MLEGRVHNYEARELRTPSRRERFPNHNPTAVAWTEIQVLDTLRRCEAPDVIAGSGGR